MLLVKYKDPIKKMRERPAKVDAMTLGVKELRKHRNKCKLTRLRTYRTNWKIGKYDGRHKWNPRSARWQLGYAQNCMNLA